jgi:hypothetical protein
MTCSMCKCAEHKMGSDLKDRNPDLFKKMCIKYPGFEIDNSFPMTVENGNLQRVMSRAGIQVALCPNCVSQIRNAQGQFGKIEVAIDKLFKVDAEGNPVFHEHLWF